MSSPDPTPPPLTPEALANRGTAKRAKGDLHGALEDFNHAIQLKPTLAPAYNNRGLLHQSQSNFDAALADFSKAIDLDPTLAPAFLNRGDLHRIRKNLPAALADLSRAIQLKPTPIAHNSRGVVHQSLKNFPDAIADYTNALELAPNNLVFLKNRAAAHHAQGNDLAELADLEQLAPLQPDTAESRLKRAALKWKTNNHQAALPDFNQAIALNPALPDAWFQRGLLQRLLGHIDDAIADLEKSLQLQPNSPSIKEILKLAKKERATARKKTATPSPPSTLIPKIPLTNSTLLLRTDFSSDTAFQTLLTTLKNLPEEDAPTLNIINDPAFAGITPENLLNHVPVPSPITFAFLADATTLLSPDFPLLLLDLEADPIQSLRIPARLLPEVEANLSTANLSFEDFQSASPNGTFQGF